MNQKTQIEELTDKVSKVIEMYQEEYPDVKMDRDYFPFKLSEEWGECLQTYLMLTDRGRQKGKSKEEIQDMLGQELADVLGYLLTFAKKENIDLVHELEKKWFVYLNEKN